MRPVEGLAWRRVDDEVVVLNPVTGVVTALNLTGALLWGHLCMGTDENTLVEVLREAHGIDISTARHDVIAFLDRLRSLGLLMCADT